MNLNNQIKALNGQKKRNPNMGFPHKKKKKKKIGLNYIKNFLIEEQIGKSKLKTKLTSILASITTSVFQN